MTNIKMSLILDMFAASSLSAVGLRKDVFLQCKIVQGKTFFAFFFGSCCIVFLERPPFFKVKKKNLPSPAASSGIIAHTPFTIQKLIKGPNCMDQLRLQESSGVYISKGGAPAAAESITTRAFSPPCPPARPRSPARPPRDLPASSATVSSFPSGLRLKCRNSLWSDLPYYAND